MGGAWVIPEGVRCEMRVPGRPWWRSRTKMEHLLGEGCRVEGDAVIFSWEGKEIRVALDEVVE